MTKHKVAFCGASGAGISPLAQILVKKGYEVYGSDASFDKGIDAKNRQALIDAGVNIIPQDGSGITDDMECLYVSSAIDDKNLDIKAAIEKNIPIKKRSDLLAEIFHQYSRNIAVGGTAGKTTTTAMVGYILDKLNLNPCIINGGILKNYENNVGLANYLYNECEICVIEADESDGSIKKYHPYIGVINNISHDHTSIEELIQYFEVFASNIQHALIVNYDCPLAKNIRHNKNTFSFSIKDRNADIFAYNIEAIMDGIKYSIDGRSYKLGIVGKYNVSNALAAISTCVMLGIDKFDAALALEDFTGVKRRMEKIGTSKNITFYNDYAHNPSKIAAALSSLKDFPGRVIAMYQSHSPFSAQNTGEELGQFVAEVLDDNDIFVMPEVYMLTPEDKGITAENIINSAVKAGMKNAFFMPKQQDIYEYILKTAKSGDRVVIIGARDNSLPEFTLNLVNAV